MKIITNIIEDWNKKKYDAVEKVLKRYTHNCPESEIKNRLRKVVYVTCPNIEEYYWDDELIMKVCLDICDNRITLTFKQND